MGTRVTEGLSHVRRRLVCGALAGLLMGALSSSWALLKHPPETTSAWFAVAFAAGLLALPAALLALVFGGLLDAATQARLFHSSFHSLTPGTRVAGADLGVERGAAWFVLVAMVAGVAVVLEWLLRRLLSLQDLEFAAAALLLLGVLVLVLLPFCAFAFWRGACAVGAWLSVRGLFPWPPSPFLRFLLFLTIPWGIWLYSLLDEHAESFGVMGWLPLSILLLLIGGAARLSLEDRRLSAGKLQSAAAWTVSALAVMALGFAAVGLRSYPAAAKATEDNVAARLALQLAHVLTDVDGDGHSSLFAGSDCDAIDAAVFPGAPEVSGNGRDEDCDGQDGGSYASTEKGSTFSGVLSVDQVKPYNVVWIVVDALRADHLGKNIGSESLTPALDRLARRALRFEQAYSQSSSTRISFPSFLSGRNPGQIRWKKRGRRYQIQPSQPMLPQALGESGYRTGFVATKWFEEHVPTLPNSFDDFRDAWMGQDYRKARRASAASTTARAIEFVESNPSTKPFFLTLYYEGPHAPYHDHQSHGFPAAGKAQTDLYASEVALADHQLGFLLSYLEAKPALWKNTILVVTADHGEEFGEHGGKHHSRTCHVESVHVPLLVRVPKIEAQSFAQPVSLVDVVPTLLELMGQHDALTELDGLSLLHGLGSGLSADRPIFCSIFGDSKPRASLKRSVRSGGFSLLREYKSGRVSLFDLEADPGEQRDISAEPTYAAQLSRLSALLDSSPSGVFEN